MGEGLGEGLPGIGGLDRHCNLPSTPEFSHTVPCTEVPRTPGKSSEKTMQEEQNDEEEDNGVWPDLDEYLDETVGGAIRSYQRRKLILWLVRTVIGALLFGWLANTYPWGKWVLITWIPLAILSLVAIIVLPKRMGPSMDRFDLDDSEDSESDD